MSFRMIDVLLEQMSTLMSQRSWAEALQKGQTLLGMLPANDYAKRAIVFYNLGVIYNERGQYPEAEAHYAEAVRGDPTDSDTWYNRANNQHQWGKTLKRSGNSTESRRHFQLAMDYARKAESINPYDGDISNLIEIIESST